MNKITGLPRTVDLRQAMENADFDADEVGRQAVHEVEESRRLDAAEQRRLEEAEIQRQRDLDAALADAIEVVARARGRAGRRVCSRHDGQTTRQIFELLRAIHGTDGGADGDPSFQ